MYIEIENLFEKVMFWIMWYGTDAIILFTGIVILLSLIQDHKKTKRTKRLYHDVYIVDKSKMEILDREDKEND